ncbi:hypothetical protein E3T42_10800 [Cryobacterium sp. TMT4-10]|nr:hypothetical protein E3T42_10800 [Cryobacterium sp. TMT4-10]
MVNQITGNVTVPEQAPALHGATGYETTMSWYATRYKQGGRTVYSIDLSPSEIVGLIARPDPTRVSPGNRTIRPAHAAAFGKYIRENKRWTAPGLILRAPAMFHFKTLDTIAGAEFGTVSFARLALRDIHILDGQHRILGFHLADQAVTDDLEKVRSSLATARRVDPRGQAELHARERVAVLEAQRKRLAEERIAVQIFIEEDATAYRQMFFDIADNALGITASVKARFDSHRVVNRALEWVIEHPLLADRVDPEGDRVGRGSPYLMGAKHVAEITRTVKVGLDGRISRRQESEFKEREMAEQAKQFFTVVQQSFPPMQAVSTGLLLPNDLRSTSLLGSVLMMRILAGTYHDLIATHAFSKDMVGEFFRLLAPHMTGPVTPNSIWMSELDSVFTDGGMAPHGRRQDLKAVNDTLTGWAIDKPGFLDLAAAGTAPAV